MISQRSFTKLKWLDLNKTNAENWIDLTGKTYHKTNIINGNIPSSLRNRLKGILKPGDVW